MTSTLRARNPPSTPSNEESSPQCRPNSTTTSANDSARLTLLDILRLLSGLLLLSCTLSYFLTGSSFIWGYPRPAITRPARVKAWLRGPISLTDTELRAYDGSNPALPIYVALNGSIYDVSASPHFYGPGGSYHFFAGRDATRAYVTGCFDEDLTPDLRGVEELFMSDETEENGREGKLRRERESRVARKKVRDTVRGWERMFDGGKAGRYFKVGSVRREDGWEEKLPRRELCRKAKEGRPKRVGGKG